MYKLTEGDAQPIAEGRWGAVLGTRQAMKELERLRQARAQPKKRAHAALIAVCQTLAEKGEVKNTEKFRKEAEAGFWAVKAWQHRLYGDFIGEREFVVVSCEEKKRNRMSRAVRDKVQRRLKEVTKSSREP